MVKPLKIPVMENLDDLTDSELEHYLSIWTKEYAKTSSEDAREKLLKVQNEKDSRESMK